MQLGVNLQIGIFFYQSQAVTSKQQGMEQAEPGIVSTRAEQGESGPPWHWAVRDVRSPGWADPHLTQLLRAAEHCSGWECQLGSVLAQECLHLWAAQVCKGVAKPHQLHMKQGSWGSRHFCHHNLRNFWDYYWKYSVFVSSQLSSSNFQLPVRNTEWHILTLQQ